MEIFDILEFNKIKDMLLKYNINALSKDKVDNLRPLWFDEIILEEIDKTKEGYLLISLGTFPTLGQLANLKPYLDKVNKNGVLTLEEIYEFAITLENVSFCKNFVLNNKLDNEKLKYTINYITSLNSLNELLDQIKYCVSPNFTLYDHASSKLKTIRNSIKKCENEIKEKLNSYLKNNASILSDNYIATRGSHYVLPVKASNKNQIKGIVIDVSSSANTVFIEPYAVTENNVMLEQLRYEEEVEIQRIIKALCELINKYYEPLLENNEILKEISFILLKGRFGLDNNYEVASINYDKLIDLKGAFHPLIDVKKVVSNDFLLGGDNNKIIVISGPNAGGKTVALKTIALIVLMNQCGLPLPVKEASLPIFRHIFVDIGDEQSIEQSLSGFSSHMKNVSEIINSLDEHSLVIMDELGSKTDPNEGEALAKAIIDYLQSQNVIAMVTTHYIGIKDYASESSSITLASMGFDEQTLLPTYKLLLNMVGRSYTLEISSRFGFKKEIIEKAKQYKSESQNSLDAIIDELSLKLKKENEILNNIQLKENELDEKIIEVSKEKEKLVKQYNKSLKEIEEKKEEMLIQAYDEINQIVEEFKSSSKVDGFKHHLKNQAIEKLDNLAIKENVTNKKDDSISIGDNVEIISLSKKGVVKDIKNNKCVVSSNNVTMVVSLNDLQKVDKVENKVNKKVVKHNAFDTLSKNIPMSVNLIGMHVDEALIALRNYIDAAMLVRYSEVSIIHGFGTGALRKAVHEYLKSCKYVLEYRLGGFNEGGAGATVVKLRTKK